MPGPSVSTNPAVDVKSMKVDLGEGSSRLDEVEARQKTPKNTQAENEDQDEDDDEDEGLGFGDMFPREPTPPPPPSTSELFEAPYIPQPLVVHLVGTNPLWGHLLWNAGRVLSDYLHEHRDRLIRDRHVLEFGAGGGLPSMISAVLGATRVVATDYPDQDLLDNLQRNKDENQRVYKEMETLEVRGHIWGKDPQALRRRDTSPASEESTDETGALDYPAFTTLILSDLIFNHTQHSALLDSCEALLDIEHGTALVFYSHHLPQHKERDLGFFEKAKERGWTCNQVLKKKVGVMFEKDQGDLESREHVWGWELTRSP